MGSVSVTCDDGNDESVKMDGSQDFLRGTRVEAECS